QRRHFRAGECVPVDVIDEQQHVATLATRLLLVAEILSHGQPRERNAQTIARRLVHLTEYHRDLVNDAGLRHLIVELIAFARALANAREYGQPCVSFGDVVDELQHRDGLADAGAAKETDLAALREWNEQIDDLHPRLEKVLTARLFFVLRRREMNSP